MGAVGSVGSSESKILDLSTRNPAKVQKRNGRDFSRHITVGFSVVFILCCCTHLHLLASAGLGLLSTKRNSHAANRSPIVLNWKWFDWKLHGSIRHIESAFDFWLGVKINKCLSWQPDSNLSAPPTILKLWKLCWAETHLLQWLLISRAFFKVAWVIFSTT